HHMAQPEPEATGVAAMMAGALEAAGVEPERVGYINAHGTSTPLGDAAETKAIKDVFGDHAYKLAVSSTKSVTGHTFGAAGAIEDTPNPKRNPLVDLPIPAQEVVAGLDLCIVTHHHGDHFDDAAATLLPRGLPILTQPESAGTLAARGFTNVAVSHEAIPMTRGRHGTGDTAAAMGAVS